MKTEAEIKEARDRVGRYFRAIVDDPEISEHTRAVTIIALTTLTWVLGDRTELEPNPLGQWFDSIAGEPIHRDVGR
jgi:hypothetical protein